MTNPTGTTAPAPAPAPAPVPKLPKKKRRRVRALGTLEDVKRALQGVIRDTREGTIDPQLGNSLTNSLGRLAGIMKDQASEERIASLEQALEALRAERQKQQNQPLALVPDTKKTA